MTEMERKLQLTRFLREENTVNRMKMRSREEILYGTGKPLSGKEELPLVYGGHLGEDDFGLVQQPTVHRSTFGLRMALALLLFGAVIYMDKTGTVLNGEPAAQVISGQVSISMEEKLLDFVNRLDMD